MEGVAGIVAPADGSFRGAGQKLAPSGSFRWNTPPSVGRSKGGEVPPASPPAFLLNLKVPVALHDDAARAMVTEGWLN
jgi:hypothetical protein